MFSKIFIWMLYIFCKQKAEKEKGKERNFTVIAEEIFLMWSTKE